MRLPFLPTLLVAAAVATMIGLGIWQLQRAEWKEALIAQLDAANASVRPETRDCRPVAPPIVRAGHNRSQESGYSYIVTCADAAGLTVDLGWSQRPDAIRSILPATRFTGRIVRRGNAPALLVVDPPVAPLQPSAVPTAAELPNNHRLYAIQWFFFAAAAGVIYVLALRRRQRPSS
jgi:surfeit locus 1 family protein